MKKRSIWKMLVLSIVTLGIYQLYWYIKTRREMMALDPKVKILSPWLLVVPALIVIASFIIFFVSMVSDAANLPSYCQNYDQYGTASSLTPEECRVDAQVWPIALLYISILLIWPLTVVWLWGYSKGVEIVTKGKTSFAVALHVLLVVPYGIDILIIQDGFNKLGAKSS